MPDETGNSVNLAAKFGAKIKGLSTAKAEAERQNAELKTQLATLTAAKADLERQVLAPDAAAKKIAELTATIRTGAHKARFAELATAAGARPEALEDLYALSGHKAESDTPDDAALTALVEDLKGKRGYAFGKPADGTPAPAPPPAPRPGAGAGRGSAHAGQDATIITAEQRADPKFMLDPRNREVIAAAAKEGRFR